MITAIIIKMQWSEMQFWNARVSLSDTLREILLLLLKIFKVNEDVAKPTLYKGTKWI